MSIFREIVGAICCCLPSATTTRTSGVSRDLIRLSDWRAHPTLRQYDLEKHIADGGFSEIWLARQRLSGEQHCLKVVYLRKPGLRPEDAEVLRGEARFLRNLDHPGLLRCRDVFETKYHMVMVLEYLSGGEMLDHLHRVEHYSEVQAARLFAQVASAVAYLHNLNIVHRDIKPENVMFARRVEDCLAAGRPLRVKLIDLGMAAVLMPPPAADDDEGEEEGGGKGGAAAAGEGSKDTSALLGVVGGSKRDQQRASKQEQGEKQKQWAKQQQQQQQRRAGWSAGRSHGISSSSSSSRSREAPRGCLGSPGFIAPEVVNGGAHTFAMDVYSLGVLLFVMLTGRKPWPLREVRSLQYARSRIAQAPGLQDASFRSLSAPARELLLAMLADDPRVRPTCAQVMRHPFIAKALAAGGPQGAGGGSAAAAAVAALHAPLDDVIKRRIAQLASLRRFRGLAFAMMSSQAEGQQLGDFMQHVAERRKALHRDLVSRAKTRRAVDKQQQEAQQQQQQQQAQQQQQVQQHKGQDRQRRQHPEQLSGVIRTASVNMSGQQDPSSASGRGIRASTDSTSSQRPLLSLQQQQKQLCATQQQSPTHGSPISASPSQRHLSEDSCNSDVSSNQPLIGSDAPHSHHAPLHCNGTSNSMDSINSSGQDPYAPHLGRPHGGPHPLHSLHAQHVPSSHLPAHHHPHHHHHHHQQFHHHHHQHQFPHALLEPVVEPEEAANGSSGGGNGGDVSGRGSGGGSKPALPPRPPAASASTSAPKSSAQRHPPVPPAGNLPLQHPHGSPTRGGGGGCGGGGGGGGWSSSPYMSGWRRRHDPQHPHPCHPHHPANHGTAAHPHNHHAKQHPQHPNRGRSGSSGNGAGCGSNTTLSGGSAGGCGGGLKRRPSSELELAALDPLALIRELPGGPGGGVLGRAHSAPESSSAAAAYLLAGGMEGDSGEGEGGGGGGEGGRGQAGVAEGGRGGGGADAGGLLDRIALGADMRAFSANSWTLDLLANQDLLAALTGLDLGNRAASSSSIGDTISLHDSTVHGPTG
ncbi:hypothetical protein Agub_g235, partial [Astrephomene gubernaculifera]